MASAPPVLPAPLLDRQGLEVDEARVFDRNGDDRPATVALESRQVTRPFDRERSIDDQRSLESSRRELDDGARGRFSDELREIATRWIGKAKRRHRRGHVHGSMTVTRSRLDRHPTGSAPPPSIGAIEVSSAFSHGASDRVQGASRPSLGDRSLGIRERASRPRDHSTSSRSSVIW